MSNNGISKRYNSTHPPVILAVTAHPDDESFGMGGTLALYAQRGAKVYLICATRGEAGIMEATYLEGYDSPAARRESELRCAAQHLGLAGVYFLDYRDSGMRGSPDNQNPQSLFMAPLEEVAGTIAGFIRRLCPQVVITFDPIGGYFHPDHIKIHEATVRAFSLAADPAFESPDGLPPFQPKKLYYHTIPHTMLRLMVRLMPLVGRDPTRFGQNKDIDLKEIADVRFPTHALVDYSPVATLRDEAARCHSSQGGGSLTSGPVMSAIRRWFASKDQFMRAYPEPQNGRVERDLLDGIE
ncbi:MAG TPA: PIG-L family deacetylase [Anaerolineaceae bacterium]|nr:PIG-L family deacetylase [Anaerolineaceae bacterium]